MITKSVTSDNIISVLKPSFWEVILIIIMSSIMLFLFEFIIISFFFNAIALWRNFVILCWSYEFAERTITERKGVFSQTVEEVHYFRIKSIQLVKPFWLRIVGLSNILLTTSDPAKPFMKIYAVRNGDQIRKNLKDLVYEWRTHQNIREYDVN